MNPAAAALLTLALLDPLAPADRWGHEPYDASSPLDVCVATDGTIYVADTAGGRVIALNPAFQPTGWEFAAPGVTGLDCGPDGQLAIITGGRAEGTTPELILFDSRTDTEPAARIDGDFDRPCGVTFDADGNLFVFDTFNQRVAVFNPAGDFLFDFGEYTWTRRYHSQQQRQQVTEEVTTTLYRPIRGDFLDDGRLVIVDYDGPVIDPELDRRGGMYSVWSVDIADRSATFERFAFNDAPFPDFKAGDVCVDDRTGRIYSAEADFPLTDHAFVQVADTIDEAVRFRTNFMPYRTLTHPRAVAVAQNGDTIVADADKGVIFAIPQSLMNTPGHQQGTLTWPKVIRQPVCERDRIVIEYTTLESVPTIVEFAPLPGDGWYQYPEDLPTDGRQTITAAGRDHNWMPTEKGAPSTNHRVELTGLQPGTRYAWRFLVTDKAYPGPLWTETYIATTMPPEHQTQYLDAEVIVLLFTNCVDSRNLAPEADLDTLGPMTDEEIAGVKERMEVARRFYWINSRCRFNLRWKYVLVDDRYDPGVVHNWGYWPYDDHRKIDRILAEHGVAHADVAGLCVIYGFRHWDNAQQQWVLSGSGGNTWGSNHDGSGICAINAGGDTAWLFVHEYGHGMDINYGNSGQRFHFNHFHWNYLPTDYGSHFDGMAAICREFKDIAYWANRYGRLAMAPDADHDGIPDTDPAVPVDEQRFGSDPASRDTDGDGLTDLEELLSTQGLANYDQAFGMRQIEPVFEPDPTAADTDGDGVPDGDDRYPLYPCDPHIHQADITVDGRLGDDEWPQEGFRREMRDPAITGDVRLAWSEDYLYLGMVQEVTADATQPPNLYIEFDFNNDGMTVGADNQELRLRPQPDGTIRVETKYNDTVVRIYEVRWTANILPSPHEVQAQWSRHGDEFHLELAIPQTPEAGLALTRWEQIGFMLEMWDGGLPQRLRLFEPQSHFDAILR